VSDSIVIDRVLALFAPIISDLGLTLWDCEWTGGTLRVTLDKPATEPGHLGGITLEELALATRLFNRELEHTEPSPVPANYTLEVTSPGLERTLRDPAHFASVIGSTISVRLRESSDGVRRVQGPLIAADDDGFDVRDADTETVHHIAYGRVDRARTVFVWGPTPKPGGPKNKSVKAALPSATSNASSVDADEADDKERV
jgi:ribosome maturation factor RimP